MILSLKKNILVIDQYFRQLVDTWYAKSKFNKFVNLEQMMFTIIK